MNQAIGSERSKVKRSEISVKVSPKMKMNLKLKSPRSKRFKIIKDKEKDKNKSTDKSDKKSTGKSQAVKLDKMIESFDDNILVKKADLNETDDNEENKDAFKFMMANSSIKDWGDTRADSPRSKKVKRIENKKSKLRGKQDSIMSWIMREKK